MCEHHSPCARGPRTDLVAEGPGRPGARSACPAIHSGSATWGHEPQSPVRGPRALWVAHREDANTDPVALRPHATTLHPHLGTTLWMASTGAVDGSCAVRGQPVPNTGTVGHSERPSTAPPIRPLPPPRSAPQCDTDSDQHECAPSTLHTGPVSTAGVLYSVFQEENRWVDGAGRCSRIGYPMAEVTPTVRRLYGGAPRPGFPGESGCPQSHEAAGPQPAVQPSPP
jgi:hypothetical protein